MIIDSDLTLEQALIGKEIPAKIRDTVDLVTVQYLGFEDQLHQGQIVVARELAVEVGGIFAELLAARFPIEQVKPVSLYGWSDDASMADNNSSAFNYRPKVGLAELSWHAYGRAIDINPRLNPYINGELVLPPGATYDPAIAGTISAGDAVVQAFESRGWEWGGRWTRLLDYQHFEKHFRTGT